MTARDFFRPWLRFRKVVSDAADIMLFRHRAFESPTFGSDTWRAAFGLFGVSCLLALTADHTPFVVAIIVSIVGMAVLHAWGKASTEDARRAYSVLAAGTFVQFLSAVAPRLELVFATWFVIAFFYAMRPAPGDL